MKTHAIIPTYIRKPEEFDVTKKCVDTLRATADVFIHMVDDGSPDKESLQKLNDLNVDLLTLKPRNEGFSTTVNYGLQHALESKADALLVNADMEFQKRGWLEAMQSNDADVVGALLIYENGLVQHAGIYFSIIQRVFDHIYRMAPHTLEAVQKPRDCPVTGALQLIRLDTLKEVGFYDEKFRLGWEDVAYCHDVFIAGKRCAYEPKAIAIHHESLFRGKNPSKKIIQWQQESWDYLHEKYKGHSFDAYIPNLLVGIDL